MRRMGMVFAEKGSSLLDILMIKYQPTPDKRFLPDFVKVLGS